MRPERVRRASRARRQCSYSEPRCARRREAAVALVPRPARSGSPRAGRAPSSSRTASSPVAVDVVRGRRTAARAGRPSSACARRARRADATSAARRPPRTDARAASSRWRAAERGRGVQQRRDVLQLVAEAEGAARLVEAGAAPDAAAERLVEQPAVQHQVERRVGRAHLARAEHALPVRPHGVPRGARRRRRRGSAAPARSASLAIAPWPSRKCTGVRLARRADRRAPAARRTDRARGAPRWRGRCASSAAGRARSPWRPRNSVRSAVKPCSVWLAATKATRVAEVLVPRIARQQRLRLGVELGTM